MPISVKCINCNNLKNGWCEKVIDSPDPEMVRDCRHFSQKTNGDHIRAMTDDELSVFLNNNMVCDCCIHVESCCNPYDKSRCIASVKTWLGQAKEDTNDGKKEEAP